MDWPIIFIQSKAFMTHNGLTNHLYPDKSIYCEIQFSTKSCHQAVRLSLLPPGGGATGSSSSSVVREKSHFSRFNVKLIIDWPIIFIQTKAFMTHNGLTNHLYPDKTNGAWLICNPTQLSHEHSSEDGIVARSKTMHVFNRVVCYLIVFVVYSSFHLTGLYCTVR